MKRKFIQGSQDFPNYKELSKKQYAVKFNKACRVTEQIINSKVLDIEITKISNDVVIKLNKSQILRTFLASKNDNMWHFIDKAKNLRIEGYLNRIEVHKYLKMKKNIGTH